MFAGLAPIDLDNKENTEINHFVIKILIFLMVQHGVENDFKTD